MGFTLQPINKKSESLADRLKGNLRSFFEAVLMSFAMLGMLLFMMVKGFWNRIMGKVEIDEEWTPFCENDDMKLYWKDAGLGIEGEVEYWLLRSEPPMPQLNGLYCSDSALEHGHHIFIQILQHPAQYTGPEGLSASLVCIDTRSRVLTVIATGLPANVWGMEINKNKEVELSYLIGETTSTYLITEN